MLGAVPRTATRALANATTPCPLHLVGGAGRALAADPRFGAGFNVAGGTTRNPGAAQAFPDLPALFGRGPEPVPAYGVGRGRRSRPRAASLPGVSRAWVMSRCSSGTSMMCGRLLEGGSGGDGHRFVLVPSSRLMPSMALLTMLGSSRQTGTSHDEDGRTATCGSVPECGGWRGGAVPSAVEVEFRSEGVRSRGRSSLLPMAAPVLVMIMAHGFSTTAHGMVADRYAQHSPSTVRRPSSLEEHTFMKVNS